MLSTASRPSLLIHIGTPKTGTTSIQEVLCADREIIEINHDIIYPVDHISEGEVIGRQVNGSIILPEYFDDERLRLLFDDWFARRSHVLLSDEVIFLGRNSRVLKRLRNNNVDVGVICYFREAASYLASMWGELNRFENKTTVSPLESFVFENYYMRSIASLFDVIYERQEFSFVFRPYPNASGGGDAVTDFMSLLGVNSREYKPLTTFINKSLTRKEADIRQLQQELDWEFPENVSSKRIAQIASQLESGDDRPVIETLSDDFIEKICLRHAPFLDEIMRFSTQQAPSFLTSFPGCFGKARQPYQPISILEYDKLKSLLSEPWDQGGYD